MRYLSLQEFCAERNILTPEVKPQVKLSALNSVPYITICDTSNDNAATNLFFSKGFQEENSLVAGQPVTKELLADIRVVIYADLTTGEERIKLGRKSVSTWLKLSDLW